MREVIGELLEVAGYIRKEMQSSTVYEKADVIVGLTDTRILVTGSLGEHTISTQLLDADYVAIALHAIRVVDLRVMLSIECSTDRSRNTEIQEAIQYGWPCFGRSCGIDKAMQRIARGK